MAIKYKNIVGTGFDPYVKKQLEVDLTQVIQE